MNQHCTIPFLDLATVHRELEHELVGVFRSALSTAGFIGGQEVDAFEREFAAFCDVPYAVGVASGTDALRFALMAAGVMPGDSVLTVPNTFIATTEAISQAGARPEFVDVDPDSCTLDPEALRTYLESHCIAGPGGCPIDKRTGRRISAVVPVHLYGRMADMDPITAIAAEYHLLVIEDACQAHGAAYFSVREGRWRTAGSIGHAAAFSFYPGKNLGACGEAGAMTTSDEQIAQRCRMLRDHGQSRKYFHDLEGYNGRLDAIQAGILRVKLRHLRDWNERRRERARRYGELLAGAADVVVAPVEPPDSRPVYHLYVIRVAARESLQEHLAGAGIGTGIHYPVPLHLCRAYEHFGFERGAFPHAERAAAQVLSLPMWPDLPFEHQCDVAAEIFECVSAGSPVKKLA